MVGAMRLDGKVALVTGGARGIGYGIATRLAEEGASVVIADIDRDRGPNAQRCIEDETGRPARWVACDVANRAEVDAAVAQTVTTYGRLDIAVSNAGICPFVDFLDLDNATWQRTIDVILTGSFNIGQAAAKAMIAGGHGGQIVFVTSLATISAGIDQVDYAAAKSGERMLMASMAKGLGSHGIRVNAVAPGIIHTDLTASRLDKPGSRESFAATNPIGRFGEPADIAGAVAFLVSNDASYVTGTTIRVDGGYLAIG